MDVKPRRALGPRTDENNILPAVSQAQKLKLKGNTNSTSSLKMAKTQALKPIDAANSGPRRAAFNDKSNVSNVQKNIPLGAKNAKGINVDLKIKPNSAPVSVAQQSKKQTAPSRQPLRPSAASITLPANNKATRAGVKKIDVYEDKKKKSPERAAAIVKALARTSEEQLAKPSGPRRPSGKRLTHADVPQFSDQVQQPYEPTDESEEEEEGSEVEYDENQENKLKTTELVSEDEASQDEDDEEDDGYSTARSRPSDNTTGLTAALAIPRVTRADAAKLEAAKLQYAGIEDPEETDDIRMVTEYGDEIFEYMHELENKMLPNPNYMDHQNELQWSMRAILLDWLVQVHARLDLRPETLFLACNYIDRFLSIQVVSLRKLQLCGITALFIAAKYEEINCPSLQEMCFMVDYGFLPDEILKAERFMLHKLKFELGYPGPMSFLRRISRGDDYDIDTRTLAKYFLEVCLMDERFIGCPPSFVSAVSHCLARVMLGKGHWTLAHCYYSGYTGNQLFASLQTLLECCENQDKHHAAVNEKYRDKLYWNAAGFVETWFKKGGKLPARDEV